MLMKVPEAGKVLRISRSAMWALVYQKKIAIIRIGRSVRISAEELEQFKKRNTEQASA